MVSKFQNSQEDLIERVARAMCESDGYDPDELWTDLSRSGSLGATQQPHGFTAHEFDRSRWRNYRHLAVAAVKIIKK